MLLSRLCARMFRDSKSVLTICAACGLALAGRTGVAWGQDEIGVSISGDVAVIGSNVYDEEGRPISSSAYVFRFNPDGAETWIQEARLATSDAAQGHVVIWSVSNSGDIAIVGTIVGDDSAVTSSSAYVFRFDGTNWNKEAKLTPSETAQKAGFVSSVSISDNVAVIATESAAYVFRFDGANWNEEAKLAASDTRHTLAFGRSVSVSGDVAVLAAQSAANVLRFNPNGSGNWVEEAKLPTLYVKDLTHRQREAIDALRGMGATVKHADVADTPGLFVRLDREHITGLIAKQVWVHLKELKGVARLRLRLARTGVTDAGLEQLKGLTDLKSLNLMLTNTTDAGLVHLKGLTSLEELTLLYCNVTDAGLDHLKDLTKLRMLSFSGGAPITDAGLEHLRGLTDLRVLSLIATEITDDGLVHLKGLTSLEGLSLDGCYNVTDAGLVHLQGLTKLKQLTLNCFFEGCIQITDAGPKKLIQALPNCTIEYQTRDGKSGTLYGAEIEKLMGR